MFRLRFLIAVSLLALVGCGSPGTAPAAQPVSPTSEDSSPASGPASQIAPAVLTTPTAMLIPTSEPLPTPQPTHEEDLSGKPFILRDLDPDFSAAFNSDYPEVITRLADEDLQGFRCTRTYEDTSSPGDPVWLAYYDDAAGSQHPLSDSTLVGLVTSINAAVTDPEDHVVHISACETETGRQIVLYGLGANRFDDRSHIGVVDAGQVVQIAAPEFILYVRCLHVLAVDRSNNLYFECGGGDGAGGQASIYRVNLVSHEVTLLADCITNPDERFCK